MTAATAAAIVARPFLTVRQGCSQLQISDVIIGDRVGYCSCVGDVAVVRGVAFVVVVGDACYVSGVRFGFVNVRFFFLAVTAVGTFVIVGGTSEDGNSEGGDSSVSGATSCSGKGGYTGGD